MAFDKAIFTKSLLSLLQALEGMHTTVDLRNETSVSGTILQVTSSMDLQMKDAVSSYKPDIKHPIVFVRGKQIRYVHIPSTVDVAKTLAGQVRRYKELSQYDERSKRRPAVASKGSASRKQN